MANSDLPAEWFFQSALSQAQLVEVLPTIQTISGIMAKTKFEWKDITEDGFQLQYTFGKFEMPLRGVMTPRESGTLITLEQPRLITWAGTLVVTACAAVAFAVLTWACWPAIERDPWQIMVPVVALGIGGIILGVIWGSVFLMGRACLKSALCRNLKAELLDPNVVHRF